jgi:thioredoxin 1
MKTLLKFYAEWCQPCKVLSKTLQSIGLDSIELIGVDVDQQPELAKAHSVRALPTLVLIDTETNMEIKRCTGAKPRDYLVEFIS